MSLLASPRARRARLSVLPKEVARELFVLSLLAIWNPADLALALYRPTATRHTGLDDGVEGNIFLGRSHGEGVAREEVV